MLPLSRRGGDEDEQTELNEALRTPVRSYPRVTWKDAQGTHSTIVKERTLVGSAAGAGLRVVDRAVSRVHAEIEPTERGAWVRDLDSRNGTILEGIRVTGGQVPEGGRVRIGATDLVFSYTSGPVPIELWPDDHFGSLVGISAPMRELFAQLARIAPSNSSVLIGGETGTGKELVAHALHEASLRARQPFVVVDCASLPDNLLESELFGHVRGAFTGATGSRAGAFEAANGGTLFLDEIGEMPLAMQPKLLRVLESRSIRRLGENTYRPIDVRVISATHRDLRMLINSGAFREDLYFRLAVLPVSVPPLRARLDDITLLVRHFLHGKGDDLLTHELLRELRRRPWLGNVRELRNFVERMSTFGVTRALAMSPHGSADAEPPPSLSEPPGVSIAEATPSAPIPAVPPGEIRYDLTFKEFREQWIDHGERDYLRRLLERHDRNVAAAAQAAGLDRTYVYRLIRKHGL